MTTLQYILLFIVLMITPGCIILCISCLPERLKKKLQEKPNRATFFIMGITTNPRESPRLKSWAFPRISRKRSLA